ncbi:hypothetical protein XELAEV_18038671mg [Xenopus laevis]|uniref:Uncharacterized protein n=1 Tax=Xenopus laevis TaxID=8355 RepID=A0A974C6F2_XENLA|nr:hypothetical protein XELAEV_18038641mg [Xenopus laevis]OCT67376.1 hypothetical protein XELAEV_18038671mg [Xenopus laevis]
MHDCSLVVLEGEEHSLTAFNLSFYILTCHFRERLARLHVMLSVSALTCTNSTYLPRAKFAEHFHNVLYCLYTVKGHVDSIRGVHMHLCAPQACHNTWKQIR